MRARDEIDLVGNEGRFVRERTLVPSNVEAFIRLEGLIGRFKSIGDPAPGKGSLMEVLKILKVAERISGPEWNPGDDLPVVVSAPIGRMKDVDVFNAAVGADAQYIALMIPFASAFFRNRIDVYRTYPPSRLVLCHTVWEGTMYAWLVWDGKGNPIRTRAPEPTNVFWTNHDLVQTFGEMGLRDAV